MKNKVGILIVICLVVLAVVPTYAVQDQEKVVLTKEEAIELGLKQNRGLINLQEDQQIAQSRLDQAQASFYPQIDLSTTYTRLKGPAISKPLFNDDGTAVLDGQTGMQEQIQLQLEDQDNYAFKLGFQQPLYLGGKLRNGYQQAEKGVEIAKLKLEQKKQELRKQIIEEYYNVLKAKKMVAVTEQTLNKIEEYVKIAKINKDLGIFTGTDVLKAKLNLTRTQQGLLKSNNVLKIAKLALKNTLNLDSEIELEVVEGLDWSAVEVEFKEVREYAFDHRIDLKLLKLQEDVTELNLDTAEKSKYPSLNLAGNYSTNGSELRLHDGDWNINLMLSYTLFDGGSQDAKIDQAEAEVDKVNNNIAMLKEGIELQIKQGILKLDEAQESIELAQLSLKDAKENLRQMEIKFKEGIVTSFDVLEAQTAYQEVQKDYYQAIYDYNLAVANLDKVKGKEIE